MIIIGSTTTTFKMEDVVGSMLSEELRRSFFEMVKEALVAHGRTMDKGKKKDTKGNLKSLERSMSPGKNSKVKCWNCNKSNHF